MNWTGGSLQRTKQANRGIVQKQKAYFARTRTQLQNGPKLPAAPFRPSYLQNDDNFELAGHLPAFGSSTVRHTGHLARHRDERTQRSPSVPAQNLHYGEKLRPLPVVHRPSPSRVDRSPTSHGDDVRGERRKKRKIDDTNLETRLLEANRKRLLGQRDWIGVAPSPPVNLCFMSSKEKNKVGRRRKVAGGHGASARHREEVGLVTQRVNPTGDPHVGGFVSAIKNIPNDIRIRIGTDALTTACSSAPNQYEESHASSDLMLYDQQNHDTEQSVTQETVRLDIQEACTADHLSIHSDEPRNGESTPATTGQARPVFSSAYLLRNDCTGGSQNELAGGESMMRPNSSNIENRVSLRETSDSGDQAQELRGTHPFGDVSQSLRLVFPGSISSGNAQGHTTFSDNSHSGTNYAPEAAHAGKSQKGRMPCTGNDDELPPRNEAAAVASFIDDKAWEPFLHIPDRSSSHTTTANDSEKSGVHQRPTTKTPTREAESASWSQHATRGQHTSSSLNSASLPSLKRDVQTHRFTREPPWRLRRRTENTSTKMNEDEEIWQNFVLGGNDEASSGIMHAQQYDSERKLSKGSSGYLPLSVAVSSIGSPFRPTLERASRMHQDVHDAARFAPIRSTSPAAVSGGFVGKLCDGDQDDLTYQRSASGHSATHASLLTNASGDIDHLSPRMFSRTETSRSRLAHPGHSGTSLFERAQASCAETGRDLQGCPIYGIPEMEDEGLHLVDADSLW